MRYRIDDTELPVDALGRGPLVEFLAGFIGRAGGPFVLALDAPWGYGKTTLVRMLQEKLAQCRHRCVYFNAWQVDYTADPLIALVSSIDRMEIGGSKRKAAFGARMRSVRKIASIVTKRTAVAAAKAATLGVIDVDKEIEDFAAEAVGGAVDDAVKEFQKQENLLGRFRVDLQKAIAAQPDEETQATLVLFVDELDRCRPTFAIQLLERIKHLFDVPNLFFVLSIDKQQLEASIRAVYGADMRAAEYLRRFIDLDYALPEPNGKRFTEALLRRFDLAPVFAQRTGSEAHYDRANFVEFFSAVADLYGLSLRARERCITRMCAVLDQTAPSDYLEPALIAMLLVLRSQAPDVFLRILSAQLSSSELMAMLCALPGGREFCDSRAAFILESYLLAGDQNSERVHKRLAELKRLRDDSDAPPVEAKRARHVLSFYDGLANGHRFDFRLRNVLAKVDLAAAIAE